MSDPVAIDDRLEAAAEKAEGASEIMRAFSNAPAGTYISTESGPTPSLKEWLVLQEGRLEGLPELEDRVEAVEIGLVSVNGQLTTLGAAIAGVGKIVGSVAEARALSGTDFPNVFALGYYVPGDGGGGPYPVSATETGADNGGSILLTPDNKRRVLAGFGKFTLRQFGAKGDYNGTTGTDDTAAYLAIVNTGRPFHIPVGRFKVAPIGPDTTYPGGREPKRTSAAVLSSGQNVTGDGSRSELIWGGTGTPQAFFKVDNGKHITISGVRFTGGYSAIIVDPLTDGSVDNVGLMDCFLDGQLIGFLGGRQYALDPTGSKACSNLWMEGCDIRNTVVHGMVATNCYRPRATRNNFQNLAGGFCIDFSQGCRGGTIADNTGDTVKYFCKVESSNVDLNGNPLLADPAPLLGNSTTITGNNVTWIESLGVFLNSHTERVVVCGNNLHGSFEVAISVGSVTGSAHAGQAVISGNVLTLLSVNAVGIRWQLNTGVEPPLVTGNSISGGSIGIDWQVQRGRIIGNNITCLDNGIRLGAGNPLAVNGVDILDNLISASTPIAGANSLAWKKLRICGNSLTAKGFSIYLGGIASLTNSEITGNRIHNSTVFANPSVQVNNPTGVRISGNSVNLITGSGQAIQTIGAAAKCSISGNICTGAITIASPDASTTANNINNIIDAAYAA